MTIEEFKKKYYPDGKLHDEFREKYNRMNTQYLINGIKPSVVFLGDSITEAFETSLYFGDLGIIVNRGIGGEKTSHLKERVYCDAADLSPKVCVLAEGVNDTAEIYFAKERGEDFPDEKINALLSEFSDNMRFAVNALLNAGVIPVVCSVLPLGVLDKRAEAILKENEILKDICREKGVNYADYYSALVQSDGKTLKDVTFGDDLHPHASGYNEMAKILKPILKKVLGRQ